MIGSLRGTVLERTPGGEVILEVGGVGYRVLVPVNALPQLTPGAPGFLVTHLHVRDDAMVLYGFPTRDERDCFEALITASGVGPKLALAILSLHSPNALRRCLATDDVDALCLVPGVGKRTAQRLLVDLKARLDLPDVDLRTDAATADGNGGPARPPVRAELREALESLGYGVDEIRTVLADVPDDATVESALRDALRTLGARR
ncbi:MAG TPA: Holliday junction branch migration protein RuvA [Acidimicrobiia bacterium]